MGVPAFDVIVTLELVLDSDDGGNLGIAVRALNEADLASCHRVDRRTAFAVADVDPLVRRRVVVVDLAERGRDAEIPDDERRTWWANLFLSLQSLRP